VDFVIALIVVALAAAFLGWRWFRLWRRQLGHGQAAGTAACAGAEGCCGTARGAGVANLPLDCAVGCAGCEGATGQGTSRKEIVRNGDLPDLIDAIADADAGDTSCPGAATRRTP
jgi:hypothetical protein